MALSVTFPAASVPVFRTIFASFQSPDGRMRPITGINRSSTMEETTFPVAAAMMTPTASASAFDLVRNALKSFSMNSFLCDYEVHPTGNAAAALEGDASTGTWCGTDRGGEWATAWAYRQQDRCERMYHG